MAQARGSRRYKQIVANLKAQRLQPCMRCGMDIDYEADAQAGEPDAFNAGHKKSWATNPELREDPSNFQQEHARCNQGALTDDGDGPRGLGTVSEDW
ncbi:hypothetical protein [Nocardioides jensenii]|uniref:hypothetical protein n=1 Tax=Nocardioides jensenii TaxID=1843 RepID=UPI00082F0BA8|nr:hypothetical protein [Nocardioides jensenii]